MKGGCVAWLYCTVLAVLILVFVRISKNCTSKCVYCALYNFQQSAYGSYVNILLLRCSSVEHCVLFCNFHMRRLCFWGRTQNQVELNQVSGEPGDQAVRRTSGAGGNIQLGRVHLSAWDLNKTPDISKKTVMKSVLLRETVKYFTETVKLVYIILSLFLKP